MPEVVCGGVETFLYTVLGRETELATVLYTHESIYMHLVYIV